MASFIRSVYLLMCCIAMSTTAGEPSSNAKTREDRLSQVKSYAASPEKTLLALSSKELLPLLEDPSAEVAEAARQAVVNAGAPAVDFLAQQLRAPIPETLYGAGVSGSMAKDAPTDVSGLLEMLKENSPNKKIVALNGLGKLGPKAKDAVPVLIEQFATFRGLLHAIAIRVFGEIGPDAKPAIPLVVKTLTSPERKDSEREHAALALLRIDSTNENTPTAAIILVAALQKPDATGGTWFNLQVEALKPHAKTVIPAMIEAYIARSKR